MTRDGTSRATSEAVVVAVHPSPQCSKALVGIVAPTGKAAHRLLVTIPVMHPGAMVDEYTSYEASEAVKQPRQVTHAD